jgi:hypothetical protein
MSAKIITTKKKVMIEREVDEPKIVLELTLKQAYALLRLKGGALTLRSEIARTCHDALSSLNKVMCDPHWGTGFVGEALEGDVNFVFPSDEKLKSLLKY